jgi:uncharacterized protein DUF1616
MLVPKLVAILTNMKLQSTPPQEMSPDREALTYLKRNGSMTVAQFYDAFGDRNPSLSQSEATDLVWRLVKQSQVEVEDVPPATGSLLEYMRLWERNLWFYASLVISLCTMFVISTVPLKMPWVILRWTLGSLFVLFIPGYLTLEALFPKDRELDGVEHLALSVGLSLALIPLVVLLLNYTPWGISITPVVTSLAIFTVGLALVALGRRFAMSVNRFHSES